MYPQHLVGFDTGAKHLASGSHLGEVRRLILFQINLSKDILLVIANSIVSIKDNERDCTGGMGGKDVSLW